MRLSRSIGVKLVVACLLVQLTALALLFWSNNRTMLDRMAQPFDSRLADEARLFNASLAPPLIERDYGVLQDLLDGLTDRRAITYLVVLDRDGRVMAASGWPAGRPLPPVSAGRPSEAVERYDFALPITVGNQSYGVLRGGASTALFAEAQSALIHRSLFISLLAAGVSGALFAGIGLWLTRRLRRLTGVNEAFAHGDLAARAAVGQAGDEVDLLGTGFNTMADTLERHLHDLRESQRQLKALADRLTLATRSGGIGVWEWEVGSGRHIWDARMLDLYGLNPEQAASGYKAWRERCHPDDIARTEAEIAAALADTTPFDTEFRIVTLPGEVRTIKAAGLVERDAAGQPTVMIGINWDVTAIRDNERELVAARNQAEAASRAKSEFLSNMSHEIRTPMNAIMGLIYLLEQTEISPLQRDYLEKAELSAQTLLGILSDILDFSKIEAGRLELERTPFQLDELIRTLATVAGANARDKDIEVLFHIAPGTPVSLVGDPLRLQQMLTNLADNAIKFTQRGEVALSVWAKQAGAETGAGAGAEAGAGADDVDLTFEVRDTGIGIAADKLESIFDVFSQGDASTTRRYGGSGLGLAICKRLAALMGGSLQVDSEPGRGSCFRFTARFGRGPALASGLKPPSVPGQPLRVLVVDDNPTACEIMAAMIAPFGWAAEIAGSGREAVAAIDRAQAAGAPFHLILLDWRMPDVSGRDVLRHARERCQSADMPAILVVTAYEQDRVRQEAGDDASVKTILTKPVTPSVLLDAVTDACPAATRAETDASAPQAAPGDRRLLGLPVLLVEDNPINQLVARRVLETVGATVEVAGGGVEAIRILKATPARFEAVLMDVQMPEMDGFEATRIIREELGLTGLPIIAVTANAMQADRDRCLAAGMTAHLAKPINAEALFATLSAAVAIRAPAIAAGIAAPRLRIAGKPAPEPEPETWLEMPGIEGKEAAKRMNGDRELFALLLGQLSEQFGDIVPAIRAELADGKPAEAIRHAHTLRGVAANLAATDVAALAKSVETAIGEERLADAEIMLVALDVTLGELLTAISNTVPAARKA